MITDSVGNIYASAYCGSGSGAGSKLVKLTPSGVLSWQVVNTNTSAKDNYGYAMALSPNGIVYRGGCDSNDPNVNPNARARVLGYRTSDGSQTFNYSVADLHSSVTGLATDSNNNLYVSYSWNDTSSGQEQAVVEKFDDQGNRLWKQSFDNKTGMYADGNSRDNLVRFSDNCFYLAFGQRSGSTILPGLAKISSTGQLLGMDTVNSPGSQVTGGIVVGNNMVYMGLTDESVSPHPMSTVALAPTSSWNGGGTGDTWSTPTNWSGWAPAIGETLTFGSATHVANNNDYSPGSQFSGITFKSNAATYNLSGNSISLTGPVVNDSPNTQTISLAIVGTGGVTKSGAGTVILAGSNFYSGGTAVNAGILQFNSPGAIGGTGANVTVNAGTTAAAGYPIDQAFLARINPASTGVAALAVNSGNDLDFSGFNALSLGAVGSVSYSGTLTPNGNVYRLGGGGGTLTLNNTFSNPTAAVVISGPGTVRLGTASLANRDIALSAGTLDLAGKKLVVANGNTLSGSGTVSGNVSGMAGSTIAASGPMVLGDANSYEGFGTAGRLDAGANSVTLRSKGFANLGVLTTLGGGTITAPNGIALGVGSNFAGSGTVNGRVAAGFGSTIEATGELTLGDADHVAGFTSDGELYLRGQTVRLNDKNAVVLGSMNQIEGGTLIAPNGFLLENGKNLVSGLAGGSVSRGSGPSSSRFLNRGYVEGPATGPNWLTFDLLFKGSTGETAGRIGFLGGFATGDSPGVNNHTGDMLLGGISEFDIGGKTPGTGNGYYGQLNVSGDLEFFPGASLSIVPWNGFQPSYGNQFTILTWGGSRVGSALIAPDAWYAQHGIYFQSQWNDHSLVLKAVPEPSTVVLLSAGAAALGGYWWRRRRSSPTA